MKSGTRARPGLAREKTVVSLGCLLAVLSVAEYTPGRPSAHAADEPSPRAAILDRAIPELDPSLAALVGEETAAAGFAVVHVDLSSPGEEGCFDATMTSLLVIPCARTFPASLFADLERYLRGGGDLLALEAPLGADASFLRGGRWVTRGSRARELARAVPDRAVAEFSPDALARWGRGTNAQASIPRLEFLPQEEGGALHVVVENLTGWETLQSPVLPAPFADGRTLTCFRARGDRSTGQLSVEWLEDDGSRWIAVVDLSEAWQTYVLEPQDFKPWLPPPARGKEGDHLRVERAQRVAIGLAQTHTTAARGRQEYWVAGLGTARDPTGPQEGAPERTPPPRLESLSPAYRFFRVNDAVRLKTPPGLCFTPPLDLAFEEVPVGLAGIHPRPGGAGFAKGRLRRWQPLLTVVGSDGAQRGAAAALVVHAAGPFAGGAWASFTARDPGLYSRKPIRRLLRDLLGRLRHGVFLVEGGCEEYTVFPAQQVKLGVRVTNTGRSAAGGLGIRLGASAGGRKVLEKHWDLNLAPGESATFDGSTAEDGWPQTGLEVTAELVRGPETIDRITHAVHTWHAPGAPRFVEARDGRLWLGGAPWKAHGVNYLPSSGIGLDDATDFEHWLGKAAYDPETIDRDLRRIRDLGLNAVSVFVYHQSIDTLNLLDFLRQCSELGLKVNQSLRPGTPMDFRWKEMRALIERYHLPEQDAVMAYDLAWEPSHFDEKYQQRYARPWRKWVERRHGDVESAVLAWGEPAPRLPDGALAIPTMSQLVKDGSWRRLAADYRAFLDDLVGERYAAARELVRTVDQRHPVSFRMQFAGDPTHLADHLLPYDFAGLASAVDIWEPEAYGRLGSRDRVLEGRFTVDYARLCNPLLPVIWAEAGLDVWDAARGAPHILKLEAAARFYEDFYEMLRTSGSDGVFFWWYPGGFRVNEGSDYGILEPDGTDRPVSKIIRREGKRFLEAPPRPPAEVFLPVNRDADARGLPGAYARVKDEYWDAVRSGREPGLRWESGSPPGSKR